MVELEVAGVDDDADRRPEGDAHRVGDRVADPERDDPERPDLELVARLERDHRVVVELVLLDLVAEQAAGERRGVDRHARELRQHVRQRADVVLVGVGDDERLDVGLALLEVRDVGDDEVDPEHLLVGEHEPAVDDDDVVAVLEHVHVLADLADAAERDDSKGKVGSWPFVPGSEERDVGRDVWHLGGHRLRGHVGEDGSADAGRDRRFRGVLAPGPRLDQGGRDQGDVGVALALDLRRAERGRRVVQREAEARSARRSRDRSAGPCHAPARCARPA